ncbi:MAG: nucleoside kinase, partial [Bacteroidales bacterium]|nr:nucleoside kinase [Bacteroidales bacterium]
MVEMLEIICKNNNSKILVPFGSTIHEVSKFAGVKTEFPILGAYVNNKVQNISYKVFMPKTVEFIDINNPNGRRMYALSLMFVLYKAVKDIFPKSDLHIHHSMARGYYSEIKNIGAIDEQRVKLIKDKMTELIEKDIPFLTKTIQTQEAVDIFRKVGLESKARLLETSQRLFADIDTLDGTINHFYSPLVPSTSYLKVFDLVQYDKGLLLVMPSKKDPNKTINGRNKQSKMFTVFQEYEEWIRILGTSYVSDLNEIVKANEYNKLIQVSEALHEKRYSQIADQIFKKRDEIKIVFLAGPSSSGKTTSCRRLATQLSVLGFRPVQISLDDYFLDREFTPKKADGEYDFESIDALDIGLFNKQMNDLLEGKEVLVPRFDFIEGKKIYNGKKIKAQD